MDSLLWYNTWLNNGNVFHHFVKLKCNGFDTWILVLEVLHRKANDISWTKPWCFCCNWLCSPLSVSCKYLSIYFTPAPIHVVVLTISFVIYLSMSVCIYFLFLQVEKLVLINASVYAEGTKDLAKLPKVVAYAGVGVHLWSGGRRCFLVSCLDH